MKKFSLTVLILALVIRLGAAERLVPVQLNFTATLYSQNTSMVTNGALVTTGPTIPMQITPASVLKNLAQAKYAQGNYPVNTFSAGAKLYLLVGLDESSPNRFCVISTNGIVLADVSDIIRFEGDGNDGTHKGGINTTNGTLNKVVYAYMATIYYDDTATPGGGLKYYLTGLYADRENDVINLKDKTFTRSIYLQSQCVSGSGTLNGLNLSGGGWCIGTGKATLPLP
jgi:hypothetical protein